MDTGKTTFAVIGAAGRMGRWLARFLSGNGYPVQLYDRDLKKLREKPPLGDTYYHDTLAQAVRGTDFILVSVPIEEFEPAVTELAAVIAPEQAVLDITSTKTAPVDAMHRRLPGNVALGAHPLFGPGAQSIANKNVVLTPTNDVETALAERVKGFLEARQARVSLMSPAEHDEMMSLILGLSHFIALVAADTLLAAGRLHPMEAAGSSTYKVLLTLIESVLSEDPELYASIQMSLPQVTKYEASFREKAGEWVDIVAGGDRAAFAARMQTLKEKLEEAAPDFVKSYEKMYRIVEGL